MGFGFNLVFIFMLLPLTIILIIIRIITGKKLVGKAIRFICMGLIGLVIFATIVKWLTAKTELEQKDYFGQYIIDRAFFPGKQADYQYNTFRFEIQKDNKIYFYKTDKDKIIETYSGTITTTDPQSYNSESLIINMEQPNIHIMKSNPTTYRSAWSFYLVFHSDKFNNMYFKKGTWKSIKI
jgi:hypothetical protein